MTKSKINVLHVIDKLSMDGVNPSSCTKLFAEWIPRFPADEFNIKVCTLRSPDIAGKLLEDLGVTVYYVDKGKISPMNIKVLDELIIKDNVNIVHLHGYSSANFGRIAAKRTNTKNIVHEHALLKTLPHQYIVDFFLKKYTDIGIAVSSQVKTFMAKSRHIPESKIHIVQNGVNIAKYRKSSEDELRKTKAVLGISDKTQLVGTFARFRKEKGIRYLIEAIPMVIKDYPNTKFMFYGEGPEKNKLIKIASQLNVLNYIVFPGFEKDVSKALQILDIVVIPSLSEGFPLALIEAMAAGRPIVASRIGGITAILENGKSGLLVTPKRSLEIASKINLLLGRPETREKMGEWAKTKSEKYSTENSVKQLVQIYKAVLKNQNTK